MTGVAATQARRTAANIAKLLGPARIRQLLSRSTSSRLWIARAVWAHSRKS